MNVNRNASGSSFGWKLQINAAIILFIRVIRDASCLRVEGKLDDIEITLSNNTKIYGQAKARTTPNPGDGSTRRFKDAIKTLTDDAKQSDCFQIVYVTNDELPFGKGNRNTMFDDYGYYRYDELPDSAKKYILKAAGGIGLEPDSLSKLSVCVFHYYGDDDATRLRVVNKRLEAFICKLEPHSRHVQINIEKLHQTLEYMLSSNSSKQDTSNSISKKEFVWPIITLLCEASDEEKLFDDYDNDLSQEVLGQYETIISANCERFSFVTKVLSDYSVYVQTHHSKSRGALRNEFIDDAWPRYCDEVGVSDATDEISEILMKLILQKIVVKKDVIEAIKERVNIED